MFDFTFPEMIWLIPGLPAFGAFLAALLGWNKLTSQWSHVPVIIGTVGAFLVSLMVLFSFLDDAPVGDGRMAPLPEGKTDTFKGGPPKKPGAKEGNGKKGGNKGAKKGADAPQGNGVPTPNEVIPMPRRVPESLTNQKPNQKPEPFDIPIVQAFSSELEFQEPEAPAPKGKGTAPEVIEPKKPGTYDKQLKFSGGVSLQESTAYKWFHAGPIRIDIQFRIDSIAVIMLIVITFIGSLIIIFSVGYIHDEGYSRYFAIVGLFITSMIVLVTGKNFLMMVAGWEGVGICSYLLIGYWHSKPSAASAARKAFLVTRLGDAAMLLGIFMLWGMSNLHSLDFEIMLSDRSLLNPANHDRLMIALLLILCGAIGKSAQFPLYVWLPDAMEGPTPVSALIHAATMVTAGVYLVVRCIHLFSFIPEVKLIIATIGALTALIAAFIALTQYDLKRILAYSTVSQLGYMFLALGAADFINPTLAVTAAMFHLFTHAFFKALLFLSAGSVMHAMGDVIDMRKFSGLRRVMPITHICFLCGAAALAGVPLLSGFWSKDAILEAVLDATKGEYGTYYKVLFASALLTAFMTAFYTFRAYFCTFWGETKIPAEAGDHAHESPLVMTFPLIVLALGAVFAGALVMPLSGDAFADLISSSRKFTLFSSPDAITQHGTDWTLLIGSSCVALSGIAIAWWLYGRKANPLEVTSTKKLPGYYLSLHKLYVDEIYQGIFVKPLIGIAYVAKFAESVVADLVRLIALIPSAMATSLRPLQNGLVQFYGLSMGMGVAAFLFYLVLFAGR